MAGSSSLSPSVVMCNGTVGRRRDLLDIGSRTRPKTNIQCLVEITRAALLTSFFSERAEDDLQGSSIHDRLAADPTPGTLP